MKNIPIFTTAAGAATLILQEIPYAQRAYILPQSVFTEREALVRECAAFCFAAGAQRVSARLDQPMEGASFCCEIWQLERSLSNLPAPQRQLTLEAVTDQNVEAYRTFYNARFREVDNAASLSLADAEKLAASANAWLYRENGQTLGLGQASDGELRAVASAKPGLGFDLTLALLQKLTGERVCLQVASSNAPALRLYERLGFEKTAVCSRWYWIAPSL